MEAEVTNTQAAFVGQALLIANGWTRFERLPRARDLSGRRERLLIPELPEIPTLDQLARMLARDINGRRR